MDLPEGEKEYHIGQKYDKLIEILKDSYGDLNSKENFEELIERAKKQELFSIHNKQGFFLWDHIKFLPLYVSKSVEETGYTQSEILNFTLKEGFKLMSWKQLLIPVLLQRWGNNFRKVAKSTSALDHVVYICGMKLRKKDGTIIDTFTKGRFLKLNQQGVPYISFNEMYDISSYFKGNFVWCINACTNPNYPVKRVNFSSGFKKEATELLSPRELEILKLVKDDKSSEEIAALLSISKETVKKHRKNMIARVGAKDMTSLIYLCNLCNLL